MSDNAHQQSWSLDDQDLQFMFAEGWAPTWNPVDETSDFGQLAGHGVDLTYQQLPWTNIVDRTSYSTSLPTGHGYHSPMMDGSGFMTTPSTSAQAQTPANSIHAFRVQPQLQPLVPISILPATPQTTPWSSYIPEPLEQECCPPSPRTKEFLQYGKRNADGSWSCRYDKCTSKISYNRRCDLKKHWTRHFTRYYCGYSDCEEAEGRGNGFSSKKDCTRHEQKHDPKVQCEWETCMRVFSRRDNMRDHMKRVHLRPRPRRRASTAN